MSFLRHEEIYRPMSAMPGRPRPDRPRPHRFDEFPAGYSSVGCAPALPTSASPAGAHRESNRSGSTIEKQRTRDSVLTVCLTRGDNPNVGLISPTANGFQSAPKGGSAPQFVVKLNGSGGVVYATYLGGSGTDQPSGIAVDGNGNAYITGLTYSNDFPTLNAFQGTLATAPDAFIAALNATGTALIYSTYWGGDN
jgi:Beta-propeller repeat